MNKTVTVGNATNHGVFDGVYRTSPKVKRISLGKPYNNKSKSAQRSCNRPCNMGSI